MTRQSLTVADRRYLLTILAAILLFAAIPLLTDSRYIITVCINICVYAAFATAWNIIGGYAGQFGLAHAAFFAIGAYSGYLLYLLKGISPWIGLAVGMVVSLLSAFFIGSITFRFKGPYFMLSTIAFSRLVEVLLTYKKNITGGSNGLVIPVIGNNFATLIFAKMTYYFYILLVLLGVTLLAAWAVQRSKMGWYLRAIKADQNAAESLGIEVKNYKLLAFMISAALVSMVGTVFAFYLAYIDPAAVGGMEISTKIMAIAVVGGLGELFGPLLGAFILIPLTELATTLLTNGAGMLIYGLSLIFIMFFRPQGLISIFKVNGKSFFKWVERPFKGMGKDAKKV